MTSSVIKLSRRSFPHLLVAVACETVPNVREHGLQVQYEEATLYRTLGKLLCVCLNAQGQEGGLWLA